MKSFDCSAINFRSFNQPRINLFLLQPIDDFDFSFFASLIVAVFLRYFLLLGKAGADNFGFAMFGPPVWLAIQTLQLFLAIQGFG